MTLAARIFIARVQAASRKAARKRRSDLERELAGYATPAERGDLEATLDRYPYGTTHELRGILARQSMADDIRSRHSPGTTACLYRRLQLGLQSVPHSPPEPGQLEPRSIPICRARATMSPRSWSLMAILS